MRVRLNQQKLLTFLARSPLSQNHWALKLGLSRGHWSEIVNGKHPYPSPKSRERMLEVLGIPFEELFQIEAGIPGWADTDFRRAIADRYLIDRELGQGGMGAVYLARDARHGRVVAVKVISPEAVSGIGVTAFLREIAAMAQLQHPNILPLYDSGEAAGHPFYVMPYIRGGSLRTRLDAEARLSPGLVAQLTASVAAGLDHAHQQRILHCDIKPENILLDGTHAYVMDFGIARKLHTEVLPWTLRRELDFSAGTPAYVSPEQASGEAELRPASDVYSLACVVYEMLSGRPPFEGTTTESVVSRRFIAPPPPLRDFAPEVPTALEAAIEAGMALDPSRRPQDAPGFARSVAGAAAKTSAPLSTLSRFLTRSLPRRTGRRSGIRLRWPLFDSVVQDLRHAGRALRRAPGFALVVILTLGLALGANGTMFGIADRLLFRPPAGIGHPGEIGQVQVARWINGLRNPAPSMSYPHFEDLRDKTRSFAAVAAIERAGYSYGSGEEARSAQVELVTGQYFTLLEVPHFLGRYFGESEDQPPLGTPVAVLSERFWRSVFGGDTTAVGRTIRLGKRPYAVIGVTPPGFNGTDLAPVDVWLPMSTMAVGIFGDATWRTDRGSQWLQTLVRFAPGVDPAGAETDATQAYRSTHLENRGEFHRKAEIRLQALSAYGDPRGAGRTNRIAVWLLGVTGILLVIACANIANLMLARALTRRGEVAVRLALGVSRGRLARQLLTESLLVAGLGTALGLAVLPVGSTVIRAVLLPNTAWDTTAINARVVLVTVVAATLCAVLAGLFPLWRGSRSDLASALHGAGRSTAAHSRKLRAGLLLTQISLATLLLIGAGLFIRSIREVNTLDLGFDAAHLLSVDVDLKAEGASTAEVVTFFRAAREKLRTVPGIVDAGASIGSPFLTSWAEEVGVEGLDSLPRLAGGGPYYIRAGPGMLEALHVGLIRGRLFAESDDRPEAPAVSIVTERTAGLLWPGKNPLGRCLLVGEARECHTVIGIVADLHRQALDEESLPFLLYFTPLGRTSAEDTPEGLFVRTSGPPEQYQAEIRRALQSVRPDLPYVWILPYTTLVDRLARSWLLGSTLLMVFAAMSLVIAAIGLYGVLSYTVSQRRQELGIRSALGATPPVLLRFVVRGSLIVVGSGLAVGLSAALLLSRRVEELLFHTSARDPLVYGVTIAVVSLIGLAASVVPGRRAAQVNPLSVIRSE